MIYKTSFTWTEQSTENEVAMTAVFEENEWIALQKFRQSVKRIRESELLRTNFGVTVNIQYDREKGLQHHAKGPSDDQLAVAMHRLRPFVLQNEHTSFYRICNILARRIEHPQLRAEIQQHRDLFSGKNFTSQIQMRSNGVLINTDEVLQKWWNAFEYHGDDCKRAEIEQIHKLLPEPSVRAIFASMLIDKIKAILAIDNIYYLVESGLQA